MEEKTKNSIKIYWQHARRYYWAIIVMVASFIIITVVDVWAPLYYKKLFNLLNVGTERALQISQLIQALIFILVLNFIAWFFWRVATWVASSFESSVIANLYNTCFAYLHKHSFGFFNNNFVGSLVKKVNRFTRSFEDIYDRIMFDLLRLFLSTTAILIVLLFINPWLSLGMLVWIVIFLILNMVFVRYKLKYDLIRSEADSKLTGVLADTITNNVNVKLFNGYKRENDNFGEVNDYNRSLRLFTWRLGVLYESIQGFFVVLFEFGIFYIAIKLWAMGKLTIGDFVVIQSYLLVIVMRVWDFGRIIQRLYESLAEADEMTEILTAPHAIVDIPGAKKLSVNAGKIEFKNVDFGYNQARAIFNKFNLTISPNEKVALVGPSGAGKSTVIKLLLRMHDINNGEILIDGKDISKITQESLWQSTAFVPQDSILFHRTLMENIRYGKFDATDEEVYAAARLAHCHEFINQFSERYNTYVGERGVKLSGGERQRVAIARAILRNAPILILDEATSSLDSESEALIQDALANLMKNKTVIVVAHRLSTIMKMDRIVVLDETGIKEEGPHKELLKNKSGLYYRLWHIQAGKFICDAGEKNSQS